MLLSLKTVIGVFVHDFQKSFQGFYLRKRIVTMPLQIGTHPVNIPLVFGADKRGFGIRRSLYYLRISPLWPDLNNIHALPVDFVSHFQFMSYFHRRSYVGNMVAKNSFILCSFGFGKSHGNDIKN